MTTVLCIGECMIELAPVGDGLFRRGFAGDTFNTAWYLRRELGDGAQVGYFTGVGTDTASDEMLDFMSCSGVDVSRVRRIEDRTVGLYMITLTNGERSFSYWRGQSAAKRLAEDAEVLRAAFEGVDLLLFSGITLAILSEEDRARLLAELSAARQRGQKVAFDPNMRPRLWPGADTMRAAIMEAAAVADIILPSFDEESLTFGDADPEATVARYRERGAGTVIVKNGAGTVAAWDADEGLVRYTPAPVEDVRDTTAAGDSFNAGFLAARLKGAAMGEAIAAGAQRAAYVIRHSGALAE